MNLFAILLSPIDTWRKERPILTFVLRVKEKQQHRKQRRRGGLVSSSPSRKARRGRGAYYG